MKLSWSDIELIKKFVRIGKLREAILYIERFPELNNLVSNLKKHLQLSFHDSAFDVLNCSSCKDILSKKILISIEELAQIIEACAQPKNITYEGLNFLAVQSSIYKSIFFHCVILTTKKEGKRLMKFHKEYWDDIDDLTDDNLQIYYSKKELPKKTGHKAIKELKILGNEILIPSIFIWDGNSGLANAASISINNFTNQQIFDTIQFIVNGIKQKLKLVEIAEYAENKIKDEFKLNNYVIYGDFIKNEITLVDSNNNTIIQNSTILENDLDKVVDEKNSKKTTVTDKKEDLVIDKIISNVSQSLPNQRKENLLPNKEITREIELPTQRKESQQKSEKEVISEDKLIEITIEKEKVKDLKDVISFIPNHKAIKKIIIKDSELGKLDFLNNLEYLRSLVIINSSINISFSLENKTLNSVLIFDTSIPNFDWLVKTSNLKSLKLSKNNINSFSALKSIKSLESIEFGENRIDFSIIQDLKNGLPNCTMKK